MKILYFIFHGCHPREGGDPTQLSRINQLSLDFRLRGNDNL